MVIASSTTKSPARDGACCEPGRTRTCSPGLNLPLRVSSAPKWGCGLDYIFTFSGALLIVSEDSLYRGLPAGCHATRFRVPAYRNVHSTDSVSPPRLLLKAPALPLSYRPTRRSITQRNRAVKQNRRMTRQYLVPHHFQSAPIMILISISPPGSPPVMMADSGSPSARAAARALASLPV
jgi:hypothetical protein